MDIVIFGAGVQGTLFGVRLSRAGHNVTLIARGRRLDEIRRVGAAIRNAVDGRSDICQLPVHEAIPRDLKADLCFVCVRREQMSEALTGLADAQGVRRLVWMVNHACGSDEVFRVLGRKRTVLGFPGAAGSIQNGIDLYVDIPEQPVALEAGSPELATMLRASGFRVRIVKDMDAWLKRHAVMITAIGCAILEKKGSARALAEDRALMREWVLAVREGFRGLDRSAVGAAPLPLRAIFSWIPLPYAIHYWKGMLNSDRGEFYFAQHIRRNVEELRALIDDLRLLIPDVGLAPNLFRLYSVPLA